MDPVSFSGVKAVLFDFEGTLVDSQWNSPKAIQEATEKLADLGFPVGGLQGRKLGVLMKEAMRIAPEFGRSPDSIRRVIDEIYDRYDEDALGRWTLRPNVMKFLEVLGTAGIRLGIVSNGGRRILNRALEQFRLKPLFDVMVSRDDVKELKPSGEGIDGVLKALRVSTDHALYIGDTPDDVLAARAAGLRVGILLAGEIPSWEWTVTAPDFFINDFEELLACF